MSEELTLIDFGFGVLKIITAPDHAHMTVFTLADYEDGSQQPAQSAWCAFGYNEAQQIIRALSTIQPEVVTERKN